MKASPRVAVAALAMAAVLLAPLLAPAGNALVAELRTTPLVVEPQYSRPVAVHPGDAVNVTVRGAASVESVVLTSFNYSVEATVESVEGGEGVVTAVVRLPGDIPPGLYDLVVDTDAGRAWMPRSVWVLSGDPECLRLLHVTDIHLGASDKGIPNTLKNTKYAMIVNTLAEEMGVDAVIVTGDIVDVGSDVESLKQVFVQYNQYRVPTFMVPGNHDWAQVPSKADFLFKYYGLYINSEEYWYRVVGPFLIIGLDTLGDGYLTSAELDFLEQVLNEHPDKTALILFHHPIFNRPGTYKGPIDSWIGDVYSSWRAKRDALERFIDIVRSHENVVAVFAGHIHRDADAILDGRIYFITTTTANHGTPTYWGFKLVDVCANGTVRVLLPPGKTDLFSGKTSYNTEYIDSYEIANDDHTVVIWGLHASPHAQILLDNAVVMFYVNASVPFSEYKLYGDTGVVKSVEYYEYGDYHVIKAYVEVPTDFTAYLIAANRPDDQPPTVQITMVTPRSLRVGGSVTVYVSASDEGWGIRDVKLYYKTQVNPDWVEVTSLQPAGGYYRAVIGPVNVAGTLQLKAVAVDYAGNTAESQVVTVTVQPRATTTPPQATTTTTTTPPPETETTTTTTTTPPQATTTTTTATTTTTTTTTAPPAAAETTTTAAGAGGVPATAVAVVVGVIIAVVVLALARRG